MIRTWILLDRETYEALRRRAYERRKPLAASVRELLAEALCVRPKTARNRRHNLSFIGMIEDDPAPVSTRHDDPLGERGRW